MKPVAGGPRRRGPPAMAQMAQWVIRPCLGFRNERPLSYLASRIERLLSYLGLRNKRFHVVIEAEVDHVEGTVSEKSSSETFVEATQAKAIPGDDGTGLRICRLLLQKHVRTHGRI